MKYFIDQVLNLMRDYTDNGNTIDLEMKEAESPASGGASGGGGTPSSVPVWADVVGGPTRGPANMLGKDGEVWSSDVKRGVANQLW